MAQDVDERLEKLVGTVVAGETKYNFGKPARKIKGTLVKCYKGSGDIYAIEEKVTVIKYGKEKIVKTYPTVWVGSVKEVEQNGEQQG